jgi:hypothetical protein
MLITTALTYGLVMATILSAFIFISLAQNPRIWLLRRNTPEPIRNAVTPALSDDEARLLKLWAIPIFVVMLFVPLAAALWYESAYQQMSYGEAALFLWLMWMVFNFVDLVLIDWFVVVWWQPSWSAPAEMKPLIRQYAGYDYHFKGFLKGTVMVAVFALIFAGIVMVL